MGVRLLLLLMWYMRNYRLINRQPHSDTVVLAQLLLNILLELDGNVVPCDTALMDACAELTV